MIFREEVKDALDFLSKYLDEETYTKRCIEAHLMGIEAIKKTVNVDSEQAKGLLFKGIQINETEEQEIMDALIHVMMANGENETLSIKEWEDLTFHEIVRRANAYHTLEIIKRQLRKNQCTIEDFEKIIKENER